MKIVYTYEIVSVDQINRCMEVVYSSENHGLLHVSARLPYQGENLEAVIAMYSPALRWAEQEIPVAPPEIGIRGEMVFDNTPPEINETLLADNSIRETVVSVLHELNILPK